MVADAATCFMTNEKGDLETTSNATAQWTGSYDEATTICDNQGDCLYLQDVGADDDAWRACTAVTSVGGSLTATSKIRLGCAGGCATYAAGNGWGCADKDASYGVFTTRAPPTGTSQVGLKSSAGIKNVHDCIQMCTEEPSCSGAAWTISGTTTASGHASRCLLASSTDGCPISAAIATESTLLSYFKLPPGGVRYDTFSAYDCPDYSAAEAYATGSEVSSMLIRNLGNCKEACTTSISCAGMRHDPTSNECILLGSGCGSGVITKGCIGCASSSIYTKQAVPDWTDTQQVSGATASTCTAGNYSEEGAQACIACPQGKTSNDGAGGCFGCPAGTGGQEGMCDPCLAGRFSTEGQASCTSCQAGNFSSVSATICSSCTAGKFSDSEAEFCQDCKAGNFAGAQAASCEKCEEGSVSIKGSATCTTCPMGRRVNNKNMPTKCTACNEGSYAEFLGRLSCVECGKGTYASGTGNSGCTLCAPGRYNDANSASACVQCALGKMSPYSGLQSCQKCPAGRSQGSLGAAQCTACSAGTYSGKNAASCTTCQTGKYRSADHEGNKCYDCYAGKYADKSNSPSEGAIICTQCTAGEYQNSWRKTTCKTCQAGKYQAAAGRSKCSNCAKDTFSASIGRTSECPACGDGQYQTRTGKTHCHTKQCRCEDGTGAEGSTCPNHNDWKCATCDPAFALSNDACTVVVDFAQLTSTFTMQAGRRRSYAGDRWCISDSNGLRCDSGHAHKFQLEKFGATEDDGVLLKDVSVGKYCKDVDSGIECNTASRPSSQDYKFKTVKYGSTNQRVIEGGKGSSYSQNQCQNSQSAAYVKCSREHGRCSFSGTKKVKYGANGKYRYLTRTNGVSCTNGQFGDPIRGTVKTCWVEETGSVIKCNSQWSGGQQTYTICNDDGNGKGNCNTKKNGFYVNRL